MARPKLDPETEYVFRKINEIGTGKKIDFSDHPPARVIQEVKPAPPQVINVRPDPQLIREDPIPQPVSIRPDPAPIDQQPVKVAPPKKSQPPPELTEIARLWPLLSQRDRLELMYIARMKAEMAKK